MSSVGGTVGALNGPVLLNPPSVSDYGYRTVASKESMELWSTILRTPVNHQYVGMFPMFHRCIANDGVETANDAMEFWMIPYGGDRVISFLLRDLWLVVCSYVIPIELLGIDLKKMVSIWFFGLGFIRHVIQLRQDIALPYYNRALEINPEHDTSLINRSFCHIHYKRYAEALSDANKAISLKTSDPYVYQAKAAALVGLNDHLGGLINYRKAMRRQSKIEEIDYCKEQIIALQLKINEEKLPWIRAELKLSATNTTLSAGSMLHWSVTDVVHWIVSLGTQYEGYAPRFELHQFNGAVVLKLTDENLKQLRVDNPLHRLRLLTDIENQRANIEKHTHC